jgi:hypothetical protein
LISAVRLHKFEHPKSAKPVDRVYFQRQRSRFKLSNLEWSQSCGHSKNRGREERLVKILGLQPIIDTLAQASSRTSETENYKSHIRTRMFTANSLITRMEAKCTRRWKFESYQKEQRAVEKLCTALLGGLSPTNTLVVWGNGGFGPTSKGHASAPNQKLQKAIAQRLPLVVGSEYRSSKTSACCHCAVKEIKGKLQQQRATLVQCLGCRTLLGRDVNAANVIADIFCSVRGTLEKLPPWIDDDSVRTQNLAYHLKDA